MSIWSIIAETWRNTPAPVQTIITVAFGTLIGAWITSRAQSKHRVIDELKAVRAAHFLCFAITNKALALKSQHVKQMKERYDQANESYYNHQPNQGAPLTLRLDLQTLNPVTFPSDVLLRSVFEKTALGPKGLAALVTMSGAIDDLKLSIDYRNNLIAEFKKTPLATPKEKIEFYLGVPTSSGEIDERFKGNISALFEQVENCIFFSKLLADELLTYGNSIRSRNKWKYRLGIPRLLPADWQIAKEANLLPDEAAFSNWYRGFETQPTRWERFCAWRRPR